MSRATSPIKQAPAARSDAEPYVATLVQATAASDQQIVEAAGAVAAACGVSRAQIALARLAPLRTMDRAMATA